MSEVGIVVDHQLGERLPSGGFSGIGGVTSYQVVIRNRDGRRAAPVGPRHATPREAHDFANAIAVQYSSAMRQTDGD